MRLAFRAHGLLFLWCYSVRNLDVTPPLSLAILELTQVSLRHRVSYPKSPLIHLFPLPWLSYFLFLFSFLKFTCFDFMHTRVLPVCIMPVHCKCAVAMEARRGHWIPWNWSYWWLLAAMWVLGIEPWSSGRRVSLLNCWAILPVPSFCLFIIHL